MWGKCFQIVQIDYNWFSDFVFFFFLFFMVYDRDGQLKLLTLALIFNAILEMKLCMKRVKILNGDVG